MNNTFGWSRVLLRFSTRWASWRLRSAWWRALRRLHRRWRKRRPQRGHVINSYQRQRIDAARLLNGILKAKPVGGRRRGRTARELWDKLSYKEFTTGNVPEWRTDQARGTDPHGRQRRDSNLVMALQGKGPLFGNDGAFPRMPANADPRASHILALHRLSRSSIGSTGGAPTQVVRDRRPIRGAQLSLAFRIEPWKGNSASSQSGPRGGRSVIAPVDSKSSWAPPLRGTPAPSSSSRQVLSAANPGRASVKGHGPNPRASHKYAAPVSVATSLAQIKFS